MSKRILAILLSGLMAFSVMTTAFAEETETNSETESSVAKEVVEEDPTPEPTVEPTEVHTAEPTVTPTVELTEKSDEESSEVSTNEETITIEDKKEAVENNASITNSGTCGDNLTWSLDSDGLLTISGSGDMSNYSNSDETSYTYYYGKKIKNVVIESGVTSIGMNAFVECSNLTSIQIANTVKSIGVCAFMGCSSLKTISLPYGITSIQSNTFWRSGLTDIKIPNSVTTVESCAFGNSPNLERVTIPDSVTSVGEYVFAMCPKLENIYYNGTEKEWEGIKSDILSGFTDAPNVVFTATNIHDYYVSKKAKAPTCTKAGNTEEKTCSVCGDVIGGEAIKATGHKYSTTLKVATTSANGKEETKCSVCGDVKSSSTIYKITSVTIPKTSYVYGGYSSSPVTPTVTVKDSKGKTLKNNTDYTVTYSSGRKYPGTYKVIVKFKGDYSGTKELAFKIVPKGTSLSSVSASSKAFTAKWNLQKTQATGYQIEYSTSSKFSGGNVYKTITKNTSSSLKVSGLKAKTKYYVRVRTYKLVNGTKVYSSWSSTKSVTTK